MTLTDFIVYETETGRVLQSVKCAPELMLVGPGESFIPSTSDGVNTYVVNESIEPRPIMPIVRKGFTLMHVPAGAAILIEGSQYMADGNPVELEFVYPGTYRIEVHCWPYQNWSTTVENKP